ncbi:MAG: 3-dehydroquinate synthase [Melioribacteraceae bacterium]|nr:3-dehydroquinate synthase [Melioribacteraceae bacterium]
MKKIKVDLPENSYDVLLGKDVFKNLLPLLNKKGIYNNCLIVVDKNFYSIYKEMVDKFISEYKFKINKVVLEASEKKKTHESLDVVYNQLIKHNYGRDTVIVAIGGGIIGDVTGYAAATYMRGVQYVQVPTTILAAVDSSVGGKTAINFGETKNVIGSFYQPKFVLIDISFFKTLPEEEILCGIGEIIKYGYLTDVKLFNYIVNNVEKIFDLDETPINKLVLESVKYKANVVAADEKESSIRKVLNLGHTFAHAIEVEQDHKIKHGQAVIIGIACALYLSNRLELIDDDELSGLMTLILKFQDHIKLKEYNGRSLLKIMMRDKKNRDGKIKFVLLNEIGSIVLDAEADADDVIYAITNGIGLFIS